MVPDLLRVVPLKIHVRNATQTNGEPPVYEIFCRWREEKQKLDDSFIYTEWSVWKTYEEFQALDAALRTQRHCRFAKMMITVAFAPVHRVRMFFHQDQTTKFLEKRQKELDYYMQRILLFSEVGEFVSGKGSKVLAQFINAGAYVDCTRLFGSRSDSGVSSVSPTALLLLERESREISNSGSVLRTLNVDMHAAFSPSSSYASSNATAASSEKLRGNGGGSSSRKVVKQEIEDELVLRFGEHPLKRFKKRARAFRKENDPIVAAREFSKYVREEFDTEFATWLLQKFLKMLKHEDKRSALKTVAGDLLLHDDDDEDEATRKARKAELKMIQRQSSVDMREPSFSSSSTSTRLSRKQSSKQILSRVEQYANGNDDHIASFKVAAKALGNQEMTTKQFASFVRATFGRQDAQEILFLVMEGVPLPHVQDELRELLGV
uniref:PX domain-containing protein n=1 Tax=Globisporangium ultimum (strain ATCC 200006 / CBS 805.95 / DAOM BR144) TaxID=431595 RepID=K3WPM6_GLOUD